MKKLILALLIIPLALANSYAQADTVWFYDFWGKLPGISEARFLNNDTIVVATKRSLHFFDVQTGEKLEKEFYYSQKGNIRSMNIHPDKKTIVLGGYEPGLIFWDSHSEEIVEEVNFEREVLGHAISPDGKYVLMAHDSYEQPYDVSIYDTDIEDTVFTYDLKSQPRRCAFSNNGEYFAIGSYYLNYWDEPEGIITIFDVNSFEIITEYTEHFATIKELKFSPDDEYLVSSSSETKIVVYSLNDNDVLRSIDYRDENYGFWDFDISDDSKYIVIGNGGASTGISKTQIWEIETGNIIYEYDIPGFESVNISPDQSYILTTNTSELYLLNSRWDGTSILEKNNNPSLFFPNPATHTARIEYELEKRGGVSIAIYGQGGALVEKLFEGIEPAGARIHEWDVSGIPSGAYYCRISGKAIDKTFKIIVER